MFAIRHLTMIESKFILLTMKVKVSLDNYIEKIFERL